MGGAYYNEVSPHAADWLRNLIAAGLIAPGDVDQRDIRDVCPGDLAGYAQCHFYAGVGLWSHALRLAGWPDDRPVWTGSCPCQPFSAAGRRDGFDDERHLWPAWQWLIGECRPGVILGEQVASPDALKWLDLVSSDLEGIGYACGAVDLPSACVGAPNIRQRLWWVANAGGARRRQDAGGALGHEATHGGAGRDGRKPDGDHVAGRHGADRAAGGLADADSGQRHRVAGGEGCLGDGPAAGWQQGHGFIERGGEAGWLADAESGGCGVDGLLGEAAGGGQGPGQPALGDEAAGGGLADAIGERRETGGRPQQPKPPARSLPDHDGAAGRMGDPAGAGPSPPAHLGPHRGKEGAGARDAEPERPGGPSDPWRDLEWIDCLDGKRRPVEPGLQRVASGHPAGMGRRGAYPLAQRQPGDVHKLRAYGNAINPVVAAEVIRACMGAAG